MTNAFNIDGCKSDLAGIEKLPLDTDPVYSGSYRKYLGFTVTEPFDNIRPGPIVSPIKGAGGAVNPVYSDIIPVRVRLLANNGFPAWGPYMEKRYEFKDYNTDERLFYLRWFYDGRVTATTFVNSLLNVNIYYNPPYNIYLSHATAGLIFYTYDENDKNVKTDINILWLNEHIKPASCPDPEG